MSKEDGKLRALVTIDDETVRTLIRGQVKQVLRNDEMIISAIEEVRDSEIKKRIYAVTGRDDLRQWMKEEIKECVHHELRSMGIRAQCMTFMKEFMYALLNPEQKEQELIATMFQDELAALEKEKTT